VPEQRVVAAARAWAAALQATHPEIVRIGYFGSYARGDYVPGSDLDVLIEVSALTAEGGSKRRSAAERATPYRPDSFPVGVDVFVYTTAELGELRAAKAGFIRTIDTEFRLLGDES
jgi:predicted nucleotidyltransferase